MTASAYVNNKEKLRHSNDINTIPARIIMPNTPTPTSDRTKKKHACGHCKEDTKGSVGTSISCGFCESFFHLKCIDGMTAEFIESCDKMNKMFGGSAFLCVICRKLTAKLNKSFVEVEMRMKGIEEKLKIAELERDFLKQKVDRMENKTDQVKDKVVDMEKEIESGMEKAKMEMTQEMAKEMSNREAKSSNITVYGLKESEKEPHEEAKKEDEEKVMDMIREIGVEPQGLIEVQYRAGRVKGERPRPTIVKVEDDETREKLMDNARKLARKDGWKDVFIALDMTPAQREESKRAEAQLRESAAKQTEEAITAGKKGKWVVVGRRGRRKLMWWEERERRE